MPYGEQNITSIRKTVDSGVSLSLSEARFLLDQYEWTLGQIQRWQDEFGKIVEIRDRLLDEIQEIQEHN